MLKRLLDIAISLIGLVIISPVILPVLFIVWFQDKHSPLYIAPRVGLNENDFRMVKIRSMIINADASGVDSTAADDQRITPIGALIRKFKFDELTQLWNVLCGDMSLVGPRPNVRHETDLYTDEEKKLLSVRPGVTDLASIVFSDEGEIIEGSVEPDLAYNQLIRPWKSRLGLFYIQNQSFRLDLEIIYITAFAIVSRPLALDRVSKILERLEAPEEIKIVSLRKEKLVPHHPPGAEMIVTSRDRTVNS